MPLEALLRNRDKSAVDLVGLVRFDGCGCVSEALRRVWGPADGPFEQAVQELEKRIRSLDVARCALPSVGGRVEFLHFLLYRLKDGSTVFGGAPLPLWGLEAEGEETEEVRPGADGLRLRSRPQKARAQQRNDAGEVVSLQLPVLAPFYRVHNGFGSLLKDKHLPLLPASPLESFGGSCYYVYPSQAVQPVPAQPTLLWFARVDSSCVACADGSRKRPWVIYCEHGIQFTEDDEPILDFVADTLANISGRELPLL